MEQDKLNYTLLATGMASQRFCFQACANAQLRVRLRLCQKQRQLPEYSSFRQVVTGRNEHVTISEPDKYGNSTHRA